MRFSLALSHTRVCSKHRWWKFQLCSTCALYHTRVGVRKRMRVLCGTNSPDAFHQSHAFNAHSIWRGRVPAYTEQQQLKFHAPKVPLQGICSTPPAQWLTFKWGAPRYVFRKISLPSWIMSRSVLRVNCLSEFIFNLLFVYITVWYRIKYVIWRSGRKISVDRWDWKFYVWNNICSGIWH